ncbi:MAG: oxidoreductase [Amycolatopsis sp.]|uniref:Gfo/Idh/MocA family protein n=1 Tax=Amycolatopsis sp. TaxID=37632 RepID=UPI00261C1BED|nr:Gfo/Idh/MocA family oxidoreductase [Amycolatopsis sp.]MCU1683370.1 oxidoreductase [Amycolatopsis sp.]
MLRIGVLGAARIAPNAIIKPAAASSDARVTAVAARDRDRANAFAAKHGIPTAYGDYPELLADPAIDAVYNPLPNGLHGRWTLAALKAGKHVLCEKPFTANADEARTVAEAARASGLVVMEAFHYRYHPLFRRAMEIVAGGELGRVRHIETAFSFPLPKFSDIRYNFDLAGGALMDAGCYAVHMARSLGGSEPEVVSAHAKRHTADVDRAVRAELKFEAGHTATVSCSMWSKSVLRMSVKVVGDAGEMRIFNPLVPQILHRMSVRAGGHRRVEHFDKRPSYAYQLDAFTGAVQRGEPILTSPDDSIANMTVIDAIYTAAGLPLRHPA